MQWACPDLAMKCKVPRRGIGARWDNAKSAIGARRLSHHRLRLSDQREAERGAVAAGAGRARAHFCAGGADAQSAADHDRVRLDQPRRRGDRGGKQGRHRVRVRLYRRRPAAVRSKDARLRFHPRLSGAAGGAVDQRAVVAVVLLADHAADRARIFMGAGKDPRRRRRRRPVHRGVHASSRPRRGAAVYPAVPFAAVALGNVHRDDRRHGAHRRHRVRALRHDPDAGDPRRLPATSRSRRCSAHRRRS